MKVYGGSFGESSTNKLNTCHPHHQRVARIVIKVFDCTVVWGWRGEASQMKAYNEGHSRAKWGESTHNHVNEAGTPESWGIDIGPYDKVLKGIDWNDIDRICYFAGHYMLASRLLGIQMRWGRDWDQDTETKDEKNLLDYLHFEIMNEELITPPVSLNDDQIVEVLNFQLNQYKKLAEDRLETLQVIRNVSSKVL